MKGDSHPPLRSYFTALLHALLYPILYTAHYNFILISDCVISYLLSISIKLQAT